MGSAPKSGYAMRHSLRGGRRRTALAALFISLALLAALVATSLAVAAGSAGQDPESAATEQVESPIPLGPDAFQNASPAGLTDPASASGLPLHDLGGSQAAELTEEVFEPVLDATAGPAQGLQVERLISTHAAIVTGDDDAPPSAQVGGSEGMEGTFEGKVLVESSAPLATEAPNGELVLNDEHLVTAAEGGLEPATSPIEVQLPESLGEEIDLPASGITIEVVDARTAASPSIIDETAALYPSIAPETDFTAEPNPTGLETFETLRSSEAPTAETLHFTLPSGTVLKADGEDMAEIVRGGDQIFRIPPPSGIDANGAVVPSTLSVDGSDLTVKVAPGPATVYPVLVDPAIEHSEGVDWLDGRTTALQKPWEYSSNREYPAFHGIKQVEGLDLWAGREEEMNGYNAGDQASFTYHVPRYLEDRAAGKTPTTYIRAFRMSHFGFWSESRDVSPYAFAGIWGSSGWSGAAGHPASWSYPGNQLPVTTQPNDPEFPGVEVLMENGEAGKRDLSAKSAIFGLYSAESVYVGPAEAMMGAATVYVVDEDNPTTANGSYATSHSNTTSWVNETAVTPISAEGADQGSGVKSLAFEIAPGKMRYATNVCEGGVESPCPSHWTGSVTYEPSALPTGIDPIPVTAHDAFGNTSTPGATKAIVKVDHAAPSVTTSGSITEQATLGTHLGEYKLKYVATDGTEAAPQSGVASVEVLVDKKPAVATYAPGCLTQNCSITKEVTLTSSQYAVGSHTLEVVATDAVGLKTTKSVNFSVARDTTAPTIKVSGAFFEGPQGWLGQKSYADSITGTDALSGVRLIALKLDGTTIQSTSYNNCHESASCEAKTSSTVNTASYAGGAHTAEVVITDWAGNVAKLVRTINIDPSGSVAATQVTSTVEAIETTAPGTYAVAPTSQVVAPIEQAQGNDPGLTETSAGQFSATGVPTTTKVVTGSAGSITIPTPQTSVPFKVTPVATAGSSKAVVAEKVSAVVPSTTTGTDSILRPKYDGLLDFQDIRESASPETYSWEVALQAGETLKMLEGGTSAGVFLGSLEVMFIESMPAHDAVGREVPTHLEIAGKVVTLKVEHHKAAYTYPVIAGPSFEVGYSTVSVVSPPPLRTKQEEEENARNLEKWLREHSPEAPGGQPGSPGETEEQKVIRASKGEGVETIVGAPEPSEKNPEGGATASALPSYAKNVRYRECSEFDLFGVACETWERDMKLHFHYNGSTAWWNPSQVHPNCTEARSVSQVTQSLEYCNWNGPNYQPYGAGYHISALLEVAITVTAPVVGISHQSFDPATAYLFGDGYASEHLHQTGNICNPLSSC